MKYLPVTFIATVLDAISVSLDVMESTVEEGGMAVVCVVEAASSIAIQRDVIIHLVTTEGTATCE